MKNHRSQRILNSVQTIILLYLASIFISALLLLLPIFHLPGVRLSFIDALFTAASAISVTGLTVITIHEVFNTGGIILLALLFHLGGVGIMALGTFFWILMGQKIGLGQRIQIATDHNLDTLSGLVSLMRNIMLLSILIELAGTILLGGYFWLAGYSPDGWTALYHGFFASVSAFTNAGFDVYGNSHIGFSHDYFFQLVIMLLIISGAIGFPVLIELWNYFRMGFKKKHPFSLYTKITTLTFFALVVIGAIMFFVFERNAFLQDKSWHESLFYSLFQSVSTRSGGVATMQIDQLKMPTLFFMAGLMFIGASPSSVGGGIRTTTFFVLIATVIAYMRGRKYVKVFGRELASQDIHRTLIVFFAAICLVFTTALIFISFEPFPLDKVLFEICSAFGTTGLSTGITSEISTPGKLILMLNMIIGRIGIVNLLLIIKQKEQEELIRYPEERVLVGQ